MKEKKCLIDIGLEEKGLTRPVYKTFNKLLIGKLVSYIEHYVVKTKEELIILVEKEFKLSNKGSVYYCDDYAIRFCETAKKKVSNVVIGLLRIIEYDDRPFIICVVSQKKNELFLSNTSCLIKVTHTSKKLNFDKIRGSILFNDIKMKIDGIKNIPTNFEHIFNKHIVKDFDKVFCRLVEKTQMIKGRDTKIDLTGEDIEKIMLSPERAISFVNSFEYTDLKKTLEKMVLDAMPELILASDIGGSKRRGKVMEEIITGIRSDNKLEDYKKVYENYSIFINIKTKLTELSSNPVGYNIDKMLKVLLDPTSVFLLFFIFIDKDKNIETRLCSVFDVNLILDNCRIDTGTWTAAISRGTIQFKEKSIYSIIKDGPKLGSVYKSKKFLEILLGL